MITSESFLDQYSYDLPENLIASEPRNPRDSSRLFGYDSETGNIQHAFFRDIADIIPSNSLLILNETKVIPARLILTKESGGKVELLFYVNNWNFKDRTLLGISDRKIAVNQKLFLGNDHVCTIIGQDEQIFSFELAVTPEKFLKTLEDEGIMPVPKYIKNSKLTSKETREKYQTVFAKHPGSVAAPTASLHFTPEVFKKLAEKGVRIAYLTLHVGAGTFAPLTSKELSSGKLHTEIMQIPANTLKLVKQAKEQKNMVIPVGTTALRALESIDINKAEFMDDVTETNIFIRKPYSFKVADGLITNFHVPKSSLMCLVDAFLNFKKSPKSLVDLYKIAIKEKYRFYSFGDSMFLK
jgi:S-adenosylmethionine:tRNA ribosyltransferase-isomerase